MSKTNPSNPDNNYSGIFGIKVYIKSKGGKSEMTMPVKRVAREPKPSQLEVRNNFTRAVRYAQSVLQDPVMSELYKAKATKGMPAHIVAMTDFLTLPKVDRIDTRHYMGRVGDKILVEAHDTVAVTGVSIVITDDTGVVVEAGECSNNPRVGYWEYATVVAVPSTAGFSITATAVDIPNHPAEFTLGL